MVIALVIIAVTIIYLSMSITICKISQYQLEISVASPYELSVKPVLYTYTSGISGIALFLNLTNPSNRLIYVTISVDGGYSRYNPFVPKTLVPLPANTTVMFPVVLALFDSSHIFYASYGIGNFPSTGTYSMCGFTHMYVVLTMNINGRTNTTYGTSIIEVKHVRRPTGFAVHWRGSSFWLTLENPLPNAVAINGYALYFYNGSLLTSCTLSSPLVINSTSIAMVPLPTGNSSPPQPWGILSSLRNPSQEVQLPSVICTINYTFPMFPYSIAEVPYGYVVLMTNVGNLTIPLVPGNLWWRS